MKIRVLLASLPLLFVATGCGDPLASRAAFGDSVTFGWGGKPGGWVSILANDEHLSITNYGLPTELVRDGRNRFHGPLGPLALSPEADEILLLHGGNDLASLFLKAPCNGRCHPLDMDAELGDVVADVAGIVDDARDAGRNVVLATYWRVNATRCKEAMGLDAGQTALANEFIDLYDAKLALMETEKRLPVVRLDALSLETDPANFYDCLHPSDVGYHKVAAAWNAALAGM